MKSFLSKLYPKLGILAVLMSVLLGFLYNDKPSVSGVFDFQSLGVVGSILVVILFALIGATFYFAFKDK